MNRKLLLVTISLFCAVMGIHSQDNAKSEDIGNYGTTRSMSEGINHALEVTTAEAKQNIWDWQMHYKLDAPLTVGKKYGTHKGFCQWNLGIVAYRHSFFQH